MTDEEIDGLSGTTLNEAVARQLGWTQPIPKVLPNVWDDEDGESLELTFASDLGAAMGLLLECRDVRIEVINDRVHITRLRMVTDRFSWYEPAETIASGPKDQAANLICRAFLKMKNR